MNEKDVFLKTWEREFQTTLKVLKAFPGDRLEFKPHERSRSARELAWSFPMEDRMAVNGAVGSRIEREDFPKPPATLAEILAAYEKEHRELAGKLKNLSEADLNKSIPYEMEPGKGGAVRAGDLLWFAVMDGVNHRGQFAVYLRMAGGKVPAIYGPSADEPDANGFF
ncbi:MAG TPA: DinB family protein [candidate division Zixibacteria bacterium]|nr:DinB family protein [candidate division Zixibacteria bacterium]